MRLHRIVLTLPLVLLGIGCRTETFTPTPAAVEQGSIIAFHVPEPILLTNAQPATTPHVELGRFVFADLHSWTDTAIQLLEGELRDREMPIGKNVEKELKLTIVGADTSKGLENLFVMRCTTQLQVETGDGNTREFVGVAKSGISHMNACNAAVTREIVQALNDPAIRSYIERPQRGRPGIE